MSEEKPEEGLSQRGLEEELRNARRAAYAAMANRLTPWTAEDFRRGFRVWPTGRSEHPIAGWYEPPGATIEDMLEVAARAERRGDFLTAGDIRGLMEERRKEITMTLLTLNKQLVAARDEAEKLGAFKQGNNFAAALQTLNHMWNFLRAEAR